MKKTDTAQSFAWLENAVFYEIYPQSFQDSNGDGIGDINGMISRLDYVKELGCNAIWVNPWYDSPFGDAGYDVRDFKKVAPRYGTNEDAKRFFAEAHKRGFHVLIDLVPGHTAIDHPWFKASMRAEKNEYTDRYVWTDSIWEGGGEAATLRGISARCMPKRKNTRSCTSARRRASASSSPSTPRTGPRSCPSRSKARCCSPSARRRRATRWRRAARP